MRYDVIVSVTWLSSMPAVTMNARCHKSVSVRNMTLDVTKTSDSNKETNIVKGSYNLQVCNDHYKETKEKSGWSVIEAVCSRDLLHAVNCEGNRKS